MSTLRNIRWGLGHFAWAAAFCVFLAFVATVVDGVLNELPAFVAFYVSMGVVGGIMLGLCRPMLGSNIGRGVAGFLVALPVVYVILFFPPRGEGAQLDSFWLLVWFGMSAVFGPMAAAYVYVRNRQRNARRESDA